MFLGKNRKKTAILFPTISKNIRFEADDNKQNDKELDDKLDNKLDELKSNDQGGKNATSGANPSGEPASSDGGEPDTQSDNNATGNNPSETGEVGDDSNAQGEGFGNAGTGDSQGGGSLDENDVGGADVDGRETDKFGHSAVRETTRPVDRKLGLFAEFNKLDTGVRNAITTLNGTNADSPKVKDVISDLNSISDNIAHIMDQFPTFTEKELLLHYDLLKERVKAATLCLHRIKQKTDKNNAKS